VKTAVNGQILRIMLYLNIINYSPCMGLLFPSLVELGTAFNEIEGVLKLKSYWIVASVIFSHISGFSAANFYCPLASWLF
jgi:hypothetical protein